ncbi:single-stranded-DNA-specific exonuclease RecJ [Sulfurospirillum sp. T05]|uniref:Single-stranded-DNA-specific exonuclease RecJ n=1 Tax=Sulfurospirillum tamanense TaxID=2813362 RepID=A0ABS2WR63_9BACT|nr:single-stranded-DNA-specific exonuclease RecJ [Sulfurospirillum tamanensis]MBN2964082.1 single-stranded-DNA-specific exonuclease RecJ [Sulfurospirillum tamanensis]
MAEKLTKEAIAEILAARFEEDVCTKLSMIPPPHQFKDIDKAAARIKRAIEAKEPIAIVGDYDVDGVVSSVILSEFFDALMVPYTLKIPNRFTDGYGLNPKIVKDLAATLIITVDNGISAHEAAQYCLSQGIDLIITDHHTPTEGLPEAYAIINPKQEDCSFPHSEICGAQVAWYLVAALKDACGVAYDLGKCLDLLAIAIMADMMELKNMNRTMVKKGICELNRSSRPAFEAVRSFFKKEQFESDDISFLLAPLINSSGRMDDAMVSYRFLKSSSVKVATELLEEIVAFNNLRKEEEQQLFESSLRAIKEDEHVIVVWGEAWHEGVIGIVASRLAKRFHKPALVFSVDGERAKGSARSVGRVDILSIIAQHEGFLLGFGGHKGAAGMAIAPENLPAFKQALELTCKDIAHHELGMNEDVLGEVDPDEIDFELLEILEFYEPYGQKNPRPSFLIRGIEVKIDRTIGKEHNHLKLILQTPTRTLESLFFNFDTPARKGNVIDIVFTVQKNSYRGLVTPQLLIKQILSCT